MTDSAPEPINTDGLTRRPDAGRSYVLGMRVDSRGIAEAAVVASVTGWVAGTAAMFAAPDTYQFSFAHQTMPQVGYELAMVSITPWIGYGAFVGGRAVVRGVKGVVRPAGERGLG